MVGTGSWNELKNESGKDIEHRSKWRFHKGDDGSTRSENLSFVLPKYILMGVDGQSPLPRDRLFHVGDGGISTSEDTMEAGSSGSGSKN